MLLSCLYQRNEALSDRVACPSVWGCFKSVEVRPFPLGGKGGTERRLVHLKCLSRQGPSPGFARPLQVVRSPSVRGGHSPSPQGAFTLGSVLGAQIHHHKVGNGQRLFLWCGECCVTASAHLASLCFSSSFCEKRTNSGQPCEDAVKKCLHRAQRSPVWQKTPGLRAWRCEFSSPSAT